MPGATIKITISKLGCAVISVLVGVGAPTLSHGGPTGGQVVGGAGSITHSGTNTTINQATQNMAIDWRSYNVNVDERVQYIQPNSSSLSLNRILSNSGSTISGRIDANGQVILVNPHGVFFTPTSVLNVGGIIASGLDISTTDFMNGNYIFNEVLGTEGAVINSGTINASLGGNVALIGKQVENEGLIVANLGTVSLAAGKQAVLTFDEGGLLGVRVSKEVLQDEIGIDEAVTNSGEIQAEGGRVLLTASTSQDVFSQAVNTGDIEQATSVVVHEDGSFTLGGGADVVNTGSIDTSTTSSDQNVGRIVLIGENVTSSGELYADAADGNGGEIELHANDTTLLTEDSVASAQSSANGQGGIVKVLGAKVGLFDQSEVNVSGAKGGGQALIGGGFQGTNSGLRNSSVLYVSQSSSQYADALQSGDGGTLVNWSDDTTRFYGQAFARGGAEIGHGGLVEVSGKQYLRFLGVVDTTAINGSLGTLLLDPTDLEIRAGTGDSLPGGGGTTDAFVGCPTIATCNTSFVFDQILSSHEGPSYVYESEIEGTASDNISANIILQATNDITIQDGLVNGDLDLDLENNGSISFNAGNIFSMDVNDTIRTRGGSVSITAGSMTVGTINTTGADQRQGGAITLNATSSSINVQSLVSTGGEGDNSIGSRAGNITLTASGQITVDGAITAIGGRGNRDGNTSYGGGAGGAVSITSNNSTVDVQRIRANGGNAHGNSGGSAANGGAADTITLAGTVITLNQSIEAIGGAGVNGGLQGNGNTITFYGPVVLDNPGLNFTSAGDTRGNIIFDDTLDGFSARSNDIVLNANVVEFNGLVGSIERLGNLTIDATGDINAGTNSITANSLTVSQATGFSSGVINTISENNTDADGGSVTVTVDTAGAENVVSISGIDTSAGTRNTDGTGNAGGAVSITGRDITVGSIDTSGNAGQGGNNNGGTGGTIQITANEGGGTQTVPSITLNGDIDARGGNPAGNGTPGASQTASLSLNGALTSTVNLNYSAANFTSAIYITGSDGSDTLNAPNRANNWQIQSVAGSDGADDGVLNTQVEFENIENLNGNNDTDDFTINNVATITSIAGGAGSGINTLTGRSDIPSTWNVTGDSQGNITGYVGSFTQIQALIGSTNTDEFLLTNGAVVSEIQGGTGIGDSITGRSDVPTLWTLIGANSGSAADNTVPSAPVDYIATFSEIATINGGGNADTFDLDADFNGAVNGGAGGDVFNIAANQTGQLNGGTGADTFNINATGLTITSIDGGNVDLSTDTLRGPNSGNTWIVNSGGGGTLNTTIGFAGMETLTGGVGTDTDNFTVNATASINTINAQGGDDVITIDGVATTINAGAGDDIINVSGTVSGVISGGGNSAVGDTLNITATADRIVQINTAVLGNGEHYTVNDFETIDATNATGANTLRGDASDHTWSIDGLNSGNIDASAIIFANFSALEGGTGIDQFEMGLNGIVTSIDGGSATGNTLVARDYAVASTFVNIWNFTDAESGSLVQRDTALVPIPDETYVGGFSNIQSFIGDSGGKEWANFSTATSVQTLNTDNFSGFVGVIGNSFITLASPNGQTNDWVISDLSTQPPSTAPPAGTVDGANDGHLNGALYFVDVMNLQGGNGDDNFTIDLTGSINGSIDGNGGTNSITGRNQATEWDISSANAGNLYIDDGLTGFTLGNIYVSNFSDIQQLNGEAANDAFVFANNSALASVNVNGGTATADNDQIDLIALGQVSVQVGNSGFAEIETLNATVGSDSTLTGTNNGDSWTINGPEAGNVAGTNFSGFANLAGGSGDDTFNFSVTPTATNFASINGNGGTDTVSITGVAVATTVSLADYTSVERFVGTGDDTLTATNATNVWTLGSITGWMHPGNDGVRDGTIDTGSVAFVNFANVVGGNLDDTFLFEVAPASAGFASINGGNESLWDTVALGSSLSGITLTPGQFTSIEHYVGNSNSNTIQGVNGQTNTWSIESINNGSGGNTDGVNDGIVTVSLVNTFFENFPILVGGDATDNFTIASTVGSSVTGRIEGGGGNNALTARNTSNTWQLQDVDGAGAISDGVQDGQVDGITFINIQNLVGGDSNDTFNFDVTPTVANFTIIDGTSGTATDLDTVDVSALGSITVSPDNYTSIERFIADGTATLAGGAGTNTWTIEDIDAGGSVSDGINDGTYNAAQFVDFSILLGGTGQDIFTASPGGSLTGYIDGAGSTTDTLDVSSMTIVTVGLGQAILTADFNIINIERVVGSNDGTNSNSSTLVASNTTNSWSIEDVTGSLTGIGTINDDGNNDGTINDGANNIAFYDFNNLVGGNLNDSFTFNGGTLSGIIDGGGENPTPSIVGDIVDMQNLGTTDARLLLTGELATTEQDFRDIESITADGTARLYSESDADIWTVNGNNSGLVDGIAFFGFTELDGAGGNDEFTVNAAASVATIYGGSGNDDFIINGTVTTINGGNGDDTFTLNGTVVVANGDDGSDSFSATGNVNTIYGGNITVDNNLTDSVTYEDNATVTLGQAVGIGGVSTFGVEAIESLNGTLYAQDGVNAVTQWTIDGPDSGFVTNGVESLTFAGFSTLYGSDVNAGGSFGTDNFVITTNVTNGTSGSVSGLISGRGGNDTLTVNITTDAIDRTINFDGGDGSDSVTLSSTQTYSGEFNQGVLLTFNSITNSYDQFDYAAGGEMLVNYRLVETVQDNVLSDNFIVNGTSAADVVDLAANTIVMNGVTTFTYNNKDRLQIGNLSGDVLETVQFSDTVNLGGGTLQLTATTIDDLTAPSAQAVIADTLILDNVTGIPVAVPLSTEVNNLAISNSGAVSISELDQLNLTQLNTLGDVVILAGGTISSNANLVSSANLEMTSGADINLAGQSHQLSGGLNLSANDINIDNNVETTLSGISAQNLDIDTSDGTAAGIVDTGVLAVTNNTTLSASGDIVLDQANDFNNFTITTAQNATINDANDIDISTAAITDTLTVTAGDAGGAVGNIGVGTINGQILNISSNNGGIFEVAQGASLLTANQVNLEATDGIGAGDVVYSDQSGFDVPTFTDAINTNTARISAINRGTTGSVNIDNAGELTVLDLRNAGDILLSNTGDIFLSVDSNQGGNVNPISGGAIDAHFGSSFNDPVFAGSVIIQSDTGSHSIYTLGSGLDQVDIIAENLFVSTVVEFGTDPAPIRLRVNNQFTLINSTGAVSYPFGSPNNVTTTGDLTTISGIAINGQQLIELETLEEIDPAVFTEVRNYNYDDVAIMLPADQRYTVDEEEDKKKQKQLEEEQQGKKDNKDEVSFLLTVE